MSSNPRYGSRKWLNPAGCPATGSTAAWCGRETWRPKGQQHIGAFFELADCRQKVRLHETFSEAEGKAAFIEKLRLLASEATAFADWIESEVTTKHPETPCRSTP